MMKQMMKNLLALQKIQLATETLPPGDAAQISKLREGVPPPVLAHFDRLIARGKNAVSIARQGVCSECHLRITPGALARLASADDIHICDNCGRYLYLPEGETLSKPAKAPVRKPKRQPASRAA